MGPRIWTRLIDRGRAYPKTPPLRDALSGRRRAPRPRGPRAAIGSQDAVVRCLPLAPSIYISRAISHADLGFWPSGGSVPKGFPLGIRSSRVRGGSTGEALWRYPTIRCVSYWKLAFTSAIRPTAGIRRWPITSSGSAITSTSSTSRNRCRCFIAPCRPSATRSPRAGAILFVGTKRQAQDSIADAAKRCAQYYVNSRWLGGTLTNWKTISQSINRLRKLDEMLGSGEAQGYTKKERLTLQRERDKLNRALGGIKDMGGLPDLLFVIDTNKEDIAIKEARRLNIPVAAVVDTNCDPDGITFLVPGNDDASRAVNLYCDLIARAAIDGISRAPGRYGNGHRRRPRADCRGSAARNRQPGLRGPLRPARRRRRPQEARPCLPLDREAVSTTSASSTIGRSPRSRPRPPTRSARRSDCPAAWKAGIAQAKALSAE